MRMKPQNWLRRLIVPGLSTLMTLALCEAILRVIDYPPAHDNRFPDYRRLFIEYDATRGWRNIPNADGYFSTEEYNVHLQYNARGMRGANVSPLKPPGTYRILVVGDSFVDGYSVAMEDRVTEVLQGLLRGAQLTKQIEVIAMGAVAYSSDQELLWLESEGLSYQPDLVILMFYFNDVWYNAQQKYWRGSKPLFVLNDQSLTLTNVPVPQTRDAQKSGSISSFESLRDGFAVKCKLFGVTVGAVQSTPWLYRLTLKAGLLSVPPGDVMDNAATAPIPEEVVVYKKNPTHDVEYAWKVTGALLRRMKEDSERAGAGFLAFHIPLSASIHGEDLIVVTSRYGLADKDWDLFEVRQRFLDLCANESINCIEPTARFIETARSTGERLYYRYDTHWNENGHRLAAETLAEYLFTHQFRPRNDSGL